MDDCDNNVFEASVDRGPGAEVKFELVSRWEGVSTPIYIRREEVEILGEGIHLVVE